MPIINILQAATFKYAIYSNLAVTDPHTSVHPGSPGDQRDHPTSAWDIPGHRTPFLAIHHQRNSQPQLPISLMIKLNRS